MFEINELLAEHPDIHFLFVGEGPVKQDLISLAKTFGLVNVLFHPEVSREQIPAFLSAANVALVPLRRLDLFKGALPSKMFDAWACRCPTLVMIDGEARVVLEKARAGLFVEPENVEALVTAILNLKNNAATCRQMGLNGQQTVLAHYSRQALAQKLVDLLERIS